MLQRVQPTPWNYMRNTPPSKRGLPWMVHYEGFTLSGSLRRIYPERLSAKESPFGNASGCEKLTQYKRAPQLE